MSGYDFGPDRGNAGSRRASILRKPAALLAAVLMASSVLVSSPVPVAAAGFCFGASTASDKIYVDKDHVELSYYAFDLVRGDAYVGWMNPCAGSSAYPTGMGSWVLLANLQVTNSSPAQIVQMGYGKGCSFCNDMLIYTPGGGGDGVTWPGTLTPVAGHRLRAIIERVSGTSTKYTFRDLSTGVEQSQTVAGWTLTYNEAWWGVEALDTSSEVGPDADGPDTNMAYMGYSTTQSGTIYYRSGMVFNSCYCESAPPYDSPSSIEKEGGTSSSEHGHLGTWVYGNDMVNFEGH